MSLLALDPSFSRTGIAVLDSDAKVIRLGTASVPKGFKKDFKGVYESSLMISHQVLDFIKEDKITQMISEVPPPMGSMAPALYGLDTLLVHYLLLTGIDRAYVVTPHYLHHIHKKKVSSGTENTLLGKKILSIFSTSYSISYRSGTQLTHDEAVALIFLARLYLLQPTADSWIVSDLINLSSNFSNEKEQLLYAKL